MKNKSKPASGIINGHEYVDLGLSVKWATCNVGADSPSEYGNYYAWGETKTKSEYTEENSVTYKKKRMGSIAGDPQYDAATANWGSPWRMPTAEEIDELIHKCKWEWTTQDGVKGYKITGPNGNSIFFPAAGWRYWMPSMTVGESGYYWGATPYEGGVSCACTLSFNGNYFYKYWNGNRYDGQTVRPVSE